MLNLLKSKLKIRSLPIPNTY